MARVGIDLDGVIYDFAESLRTYLHEHKGWDVARCPDPTRWEFYLDWGMSLDEFVAVCHAAANSGWLFRHGEPTNDAVAQLARLRDAGHEIHFITDRSFGFNGEPSQRSTLAWLEEHGIEFDTLRFTADKAGAATDIGLDYMIDDKPENCLALEEAGVCVFMQTRPWNEGVSGYFRVDSLEEFVSYAVPRDTGATPIPVIAETAVEWRDPAPITAAERESASGEVRTVSSTGGEKGVKPARFDLIPAGPLWQVAELYGKGAEKYADRNWELGYEWSKSFGAMMRHAWSFWNGEDYDQETGAPHLASVTFHAFALLEFMQTHPDFDNRPSTLRDRRAAQDVELADWERDLLGLPVNKRDDECDERCCRTT